MFWSWTFTCCLFEKPTKEFYTLKSFFSKVFCLVKNLFFSAPKVLSTLFLTLFAEADQNMETFVFVSYQFQRKKGAGAETSLELGIGTKTRTESHKF